MRILLASMELSSLTGQPMYTYNLAKGLRELGHEVVCVGLHAEGIMAEKFKELGCLTTDIKDSLWKGKYDMVLIGENIPEYLDGIECDRVYNICHSKGEADKPIINNKITGYLAPREQVSDYWKEQFNVEFEILPIPIDFERFKEREPQDRYTILAPCTRDTLRRPMLVNLIERAKAQPNSQVWIVGADFNGLSGVLLPQNVRIFPPVTDIEEFYKRADEVAGIFIGTVTIEAWAAGLETSVYDENGDWEYVERPADFEKYNYKKVTEKFLSL